MIIGQFIYNNILSFLCLQVSIDPPVSALHATDEKENIEMIWCQQPVPKFRGILTFLKNNK